MGKAFKQTLEEKLKRVKIINSAIKRYKSIGIRGSDKLDGLLEERYELEWNIHRNLDKQKISNSILDYCFKNLISSDEKRTRTVYDKIPLVEEFVKNIKDFKGEKILSVQGSNMETGIISGVCEFKIGEKKFRSLYVPVEKSLSFNPEKKEWIKGKTNLVYVSKDIFGYNHTPFFDLFPNLANPLGKALEKAGLKILKRKRGNIWEADYSQTLFIGGKGPSNIKIYIGNDFVEQGLEENSTYKIPAQTRRVPVPLF